MIARRSGLRRRAGNKRAIEAAGLSFILGMKIPEIPYVVQEWRREHAGEPMPDGLILIQL